MSTGIPQFHPHPLKARLRERKLKLWQLRKLLGGNPCEGSLSRYLNGVWDMPVEVEDRIKETLQQVNHEMG